MTQESPSIESKESREYVGTLGNGARVFVDPVHSHAATHLKNTPALLQLVQEALPKINAPGEGGQFEIDLGRIVGSSSCVETHEGEEILYAKRPNRTSYTRFVKNRESVPVQTLVLRYAEKSGK